MWKDNPTNKVEQGSFQQAGREMLALVTLNWAYGGIKVRQNAHTVHVLNIHIAEGMETINHLLKHMSVTPKVDELLKKNVVF